jgi:hypothetical protein
LDKHETTFVHSTLSIILLFLLMKRATADPAAYSIRQSLAALARGGLAGFTACQMAAAASCDTWRPHLAGQRATSDCKQFAPDWAEHRGRRAMYRLRRPALWNLHLFWETESSRDTLTFNFQVNT